MRIKDMFSEKRHWRSFHKRVNKLPEDYQIVYKEIEKYFLKVYPVNYLDLVEQVIELFEQGAAENQSVLAITGRDIAGFCDALIDDTPTQADTTEKEINQSSQVSMEKSRKKGADRNDESY